MSLKKIAFSSAAFAATIVLTLSAWIPATSSGSPTAKEGNDEYQPIQSISYDFGSKSTSGYFEQHDGACFVMLMISEKSDPEALLPVSPTRVRLVLFPGEIAGLDSEEGHSLNFACGTAAATLLVTEGGRARLVALQKLMLPETVASP